MKKLLILLCAVCCLAAVGCSETDETEESAGAQVDTSVEIHSETFADTSAETDASETEPENISDAETITETEEVPMPEVFLSLREVDTADFPENFTPDEVFLEAVLEAVSAELAEKLPDLPICARVTYIQSHVQDGFQRHYVSCEIYPTGAEIREENLLYSPFSVGITLTDDGYISAEPAWIDETAPETIYANYEKYSSGTAETTDDSEYLYLDRENHVNLHLESGDVISEMVSDGSISDLETLNLYYVSGDTILLCSQRDRYYLTRYSIAISRDGGKTWHTETPILDPLGENGKHIEAGFSNGVIQMKEDGRFYIFLGTNLTSVTIMTIPPDSNEVDLLFREQIGGYETTSLTDAAMVTDTRGFFTLTHPKYAASNAIYRTTDSGETWVRCDVPMPDECENPWEMALHLPYQTEEGAVWYMDGNWGTGDCVYISEDGGWTWRIMEITPS